MAAPAFITAIGNAIKTAATTIVKEPVKKGASKLFGKDKGIVRKPLSKTKDVAKNEVKKFKDNIIENYTSPTKFIKEASGYNAVKDIAGKLSDFHSLTGIKSVNKTMAKYANKVEQIVKKTGKYNNMLPQKTAKQLNKTVKQLGKYQRKAIEQVLRQYTNEQIREAFGFDILNPKKELKRMLKITTLENKVDLFNTLMGNKNFHSTKGASFLLENTTKMMVAHMRNEGYSQQSIDALLRDFDKIRKDPSKVDKFNDAFNSGKPQKNGKTKPRGEYADYSEDLEQLFDNYASEQNKITDDSETQYVSERLEHLKEVFYNIARS